jgi:hypothetical protein
MSVCGVTGWCRIALQAAAVISYMYCRAEEGEEWSNARCSPVKFRESIAGGSDQRARMGEGIRTASPMRQLAVLRLGEGRLSHSTEWYQNLGGKTQVRAKA